MARKKIIDILPLFYLLILIGGLLGCDNKNRDSSFLFFDFGNEGMISGREYIFYPNDSSYFPPHNNDAVFYLLIRYTDNCKINSLPVSIEYTSLMNDSTTVNFIDIPLFDDTDKFLGKGNFGVYERLFPLNLKISADSYISVLTQEKNTTGIISLGLLRSQQISNKNGTDK